MGKLFGRLRHGKRFIGRGTFTHEEIAWMVAHATGYNTGVVLSPEEGDLAAAIESVADVSPLFAAHALVAERLVGEIAMTAEEVAHVAEHPDAGRFVLVADASLLALLAEAERRAKTRREATEVYPTPSPPVEAAPTGDNATGAVSAPLVV